MIRRTLPPHVYKKRGKLQFKRRAGHGWYSVTMEATDPASSEFFAEYAGLLRGKPGPIKGDGFRALIASYKRSERYAALASRTRADYDKHLAWIDDKIGHLSPGKMQRKDVVAIRDGGLPAYFVNYTVAVLRVLMEHAIDKGIREDNPAKGVRKKKGPTIDRQPWPQDLVDAARETATGRTLVLFELLIGTGQRISDVLRMQWGQIDGGGINVRQGKTGKDLFVPFTPRLVAVLSEAPRDGLLILTSRRGAWRYRGAADAMMRLRKSIGATDYDIHALRYTAATELLLAGCGDDEIAAITGQSPAMVIHYTRQTRQKVRAIRAQKRRE